MHLTCPSCGNPEAEVLPNDMTLPLGSVERDSIRCCVACRPGPHIHWHICCLKPGVEQVVLRQMDALVLLEAVRREL